MFLESCENFLITGFGLHNDVVKIHEQYLKYVVIQAGLHKPLEGRRAVGQSCGHPVVLGDSKLCFEGSLVSVLFIHGKLIESVC